MRKRLQTWTYNEIISCKVEIAISDITSCISQYIWFVNPFRRSDRGFSEKIWSLYRVILNMLWALKGSILFGDEQPRNAYQRNNGNRMLSQCFESLIEKWWIVLLSTSWMLASNKGLVDCNLVHLKNFVVFFIILPPRDATPISSFCIPFAIWL